MNTVEGGVFKHLPDLFFADSFRLFLEHTLGAEGLLIFNPREPEIAQTLLPIYERTLDEYSAHQLLLEERSEELSELGFEEQVSIRRADRVRIVKMDPEKQWGSE